MINKDAKLLVSQLRSIMLNKKINKEQHCESEGLQELQEAVFYMGNCMSEFQSFMSELCEGNLDVEPPGRQNFLSGRLKELHSILRHLTWQTTQVAEGDYRQEVHFLGEFSVSFNKMVKQLEEREISLKAKTEALLRSKELLVSVMDKQQDWILVVDRDTCEILYVNKTAKEEFVNVSLGQKVVKTYAAFFNDLMESMGSDEYEKEHQVEETEKFLSVKGYPLSWEDRAAFAFFISDVTEEAKQKRELENMVYEDELTSVFNRRYCLEKMETLLKKQVAFCLGVIDIDKLKYVNDTFGHVVGDEYILLVSGYVEEIVRTSDSVCRIGGDEFVVILPECEKAAVQEKMEQVQINLAGLQKEYTAAISYGVVYVDKENQLAAEQILVLADEAMYLMKQEHHKKQSDAK